MKKRLFRWDQKGLSESLATTIEVHSLADMTSYILKDFPADNYLHNIRISDERLDDSSRAGEDWRELYRVVADFEGYTGQCIGYCNFKADSTPQEQLEEAISLASHKHAGQVDKGGMPYILHPLRVMLSVQREYIQQQEKPDYWNMCMAAVLHDVVEDTGTTYEELAAYGFSQEVIDLISLLTKNPGEDYASYIDRICQSRNKQAMAIKIADLFDNMDKRRMQEPFTEKDKERMNKYSFSWTKIKGWLQLIENK